MDRDSLVRLFDYHYWANRRLWRSVMALSDWQFTQTLSDGSPSVQTQIISMVAHENLWVNYLWHGETEFLQETQFPTRASIRHEWDALEEEMRDFIDELSPATLESRVAPPFLTVPVQLTVGESLLHVVHHAVDCRGQLCLHLRRMGVLAPAHDYVSYLAEQSTRGRMPQPALRWAVPQTSSR